MSAFLRMLTGFCLGLTALSALAHGSGLTFAALEAITFFPRGFKA